VADHGGVVGALGHLDGGEGLGQRADLVDLDQDRVGDVLVDAFLEDLGVGDEQVVAHQLHLFAQAFGQVTFQPSQSPSAMPSSMLMIGYLSTQVASMSVHSVAPGSGLRRTEVVLAVLVELAGGAVQAQGDLLAGDVAGLLDGLQDHLDRRFVVLDVGREAAFVADGDAHALVVQDLLERVEHLGAVAHRFAEARRADRDDHQLLQVEVVVGVGAAVDDVHHRHRQHAAVHAAEVAVQRQARFFGRGAGHGHRHGQHRVGAQAALVVGAVQVDQRLVEEVLLGGVEAQHRLGDLGVDVLDGLEHALAEVARLVAVAQLDGFARAGGRARGHGRAAHGARLQQHVAFDGGVAARVQDLAADDVNDCAHCFSFFQVKKPAQKDRADAFDQHHAHHRDALA
jgi:hypothetical protein